MLQGQRSPATIAFVGLILALGGSTPPPDRARRRQVSLSATSSALPAPPEQAERLIARGLHLSGGFTADELRAVAEAAPMGALLVISPERLPASKLAPLLQRGGKQGFVVTDMTDVDEFEAIEGLDVPEDPVYFVDGLKRGDEMANWSPDEALTAITDAGRTPLTAPEGLHWVLQRPEALERGRCFMTIGSRLRGPDGSLDARTPAIWISNGTGRDGPETRDAPKLGWCWAGNRHSWLGFASAKRRMPSGS